MWGGAGEGHIYIAVSYQSETDVKRLFTITRRQKSPASPSGDSAADHGPVIHRRSPSKALEEQSQIPRASCQVIPRVWNVQVGKSAEMEADEGSGMGWGGRE
jgi:hypothetical protein